MNTIGAVIDVPSTRREIAAKPRRMTASVASCQCTASELRRAMAGTSLNLAAAGYGRSMSDRRSSSQELDQEWIELLNEIRILLPGVQVLFAFLLTAPFAAGFENVTRFQRDVYALALMGALASTVCLVAPTTHHRIRWRKRDKEFMLHVANRSVIAGSAFLALSMSAAIFLVGDYLFDRWVATVATIGVATAFAVFWFALPLTRRMRDNDD